jgi:hypothetical protein
MFSGHTFCVSLATAPLTVAALTQNGGRVAYDLNHGAHITCVVIANTTKDPFSLSSSLTTQHVFPAAMRGGLGWAVRNRFNASVEDSVRAARVPVVYELWVQQCVQAGRILPCKGGRDVVAYDPFLFAGVRFTTTQLPMQLKANIVAILQFYGGEYHRHLLDTTNVVVFSHMQLRHDANRSSGDAMTKTAASAAQGPAQTELVKGANDADACTTPPFHSSGSCAHAVSCAPASLLGKALLKLPPAAAASYKVVAAAAADAMMSTPTKLAVARERGLLCVTPQWVQLCLNAGQLLPQVCPPTTSESCRENDRSHTPPRLSTDVAVTTAATDAEHGGDRANDQQANADIEPWIAEALDDICHYATSAATTVVLGSAASSKPTATSRKSVESAVGTTSNGDGDVVLSEKPSRDSHCAALAETDPVVRAALKLADRLTAKACASTRKRRRCH